MVNPPSSKTSGDIVQIIRSSTLTKFALVGLEPKCFSCGHFKLFFINNKFFDQKLEAHSIKIFAKLGAKFRS